MSTKGTKKSKTTNLNLGANLTIDKTPVIFSEIKEAIANNSPIKFKTETIESIDLSGIQLLVQLRNTETLPKEMKLTFSNNSKDIVSKCGFSDQLLS